jgi:ketosteroid isomerase-like protein
MTTETDTQLEALRALNDVYIQSVVRADAVRFDDILAADFLCSQADGTIVDRAEFLRQTQASTPLASMDIDDVRIRVIGDTAIIHGRTRFARRDGARGVGRYTDVWAKRNGKWQAVSAHVTRLLS